MAGYLDKDGAGIIAEKINELNKKTEGKYNLPEGGIPETDLSQEVKDKLNSGGEQTYDTIISTQEEFEAWYAQLDAGTYNGESVLILSGTYKVKSGNSLHLPETLKQLHGLGKVEISISTYALLDAVGDPCVWYTIRPNGREYSIKNISIISKPWATKGSRGFFNCTNLIDCTCTAKGSDHGEISYSFYECTNLTNCTGVGAPFSSGYAGGAHAFYSCTNLVNCIGNGHDGYGFYSCTNLTNCTGSGSGSDSGSGGYGFYLCTNLTNCTGSGSGDGYGYGFYECNSCSNCRQDPDTPSKTSTWSGTNTNVDPDTCPEWVDTRPFPPTPTSSDNGKLLGVENTKLAYVDSVRPTYFKLNGTPMTDTGGVGTKYTIAKSNLTPSTPTPVVGDTVVFYTDSYTYIGSVTEVQASAIVAEVKVTMLGAAGGSGGGTQIYDTVISSQDDFEAWCKELDAGTYAGHSVVLLHGTYFIKDGKGLHLPYTLYKLHGIGNVTIKIDGVSGTNMIYYDDLPTEKPQNYSIENIVFYGQVMGIGFECVIKNCLNLKNCYASGLHVGFLSCDNLNNCSGFGGQYGFVSCSNIVDCNGMGVPDIAYNIPQGSLLIAAGFYSCDNLINCNARGDNQPGAEGCGFVACNNLTNCTGYGVAHNLSVLNSGAETATKACGFEGCTNLTNCDGEGYAPSTGKWHGFSYGFYNCKKLTNCSGIGSGTKNEQIEGYAFYACSYCSNCSSRGESATATWSENCSYISKDTCPEYTG